jgi:UDP-glucuronate decarboxylase
MRMDDGRVVSNMICQALSDKPLTIYGDGSQTRSFCYVSDTVRGLRSLMESEQQDLQPFNLGNPQEITINELVSSLEDALGRELDVTHRDLPTDDPKRRRPDIGLARRLLGWQPEVTLREGMAKTIAWFADEMTRSRPAEMPLSRPGAVRSRPRAQAARPFLLSGGGAGG